MKSKFTLYSIALAAFCVTSAGAFAEDPKTSPMMFKKTTVLNDIHHTHQLEMKISALVNTNSQSPQLKTLSQQMIQDHQQADSALKSLALRENVALKTFQPSDSEQGVMDALTQLHGSAFDVSYLDFQRTSHRALASKLSLMSSEEKDPQIKTMIETILPTVRHHQQMSASLEQSTKITMLDKNQ